MNKKIFFTLTLITNVVIGLTLSINVASAAKLYKWVDAQGRISYQDQPPPQNSKILSEEELVKKSPTSVKSFKPNTNSIDVYVTKTCSSCDTVIKALQTWGVPYQVKQIENHRDIQTQLIQQTNAVKVPALFSGGAHISNTATSDDLQQSLIATGHIEPAAEETLKPEDTADAPK